MCSFQGVGEMLREAEVQDPSPLPQEDRAVLECLEGQGRRQEPEVPAGRDNREETVSATQDGGYQFEAEAGAAEEREDLGGAAESDPAEPPGEGLVAVCEEAEQRGIPGEVGEGDVGVHPGVGGGEEGASLSFDR